jgi:hypothetical protein
MLGAFGSTSRSTPCERLTRFRGPEESPIKRSTSRKPHHPEEVVAKLRQPDESLATGVPMAEEARVLGVSESLLHLRKRPLDFFDCSAVVHRTQELPSFR